MRAKFEFVGRWAWVGVLVLYVLATITAYGVEHGVGPTLAGLFVAAAVLSIVMGSMSYGFKLDDRKRQIEREEFDAKMAADRAERVARYPADAPPTWVNVSYPEVGETTD